MRLAIVLLALAAAAPAHADKLCEETWPKTAKPSQKDTEKCIGVWFEAYGMSGQDYEGCDDDLYTKYSTADLAHVTELIKGYKGKACKNVETDVKTLNTCDRTVEFLECAQERFFTVGDEPIKGIHDDLVKVYGKLLAGKPVREDDLSEYMSDGTLMKLRNAPYARHGRPFKNPDLQKFFYGGKPSDGEDLPLPGKVNASYTDALLDKVDEKNVAVVLKVIKARATSRTGR